MSLLTSFSNAPIKRKLMLSSLLSVGVAMLCIILILTVSSWIDRREQAVSDQAAFADVIGKNVASALLFNDSEAATQTLAALEAKPDILDALVYDRTGKIFARYVIPKHLSDLHHPRIDPGNYQFSAGRLLVSEPIRFKSEALGSIYLEYSLQDLYADILRDIGMIFLVGSGAVLAALLMFKRMLKTIIAPIEELSSGMEKVSTEQDYAVRVAVHGKDEVGKLADTFNVMLERIEERTRQLVDAQEELVRREKLAVLGQVAGSVGHELRNPLGVMSNAVYFLEAMLSDADDIVKEYLGIIKNEIAGSERIVSDLLDSVRTKPPQRRAVGIAELIDQTLGKLTIPASVSVKLDLPEPLPALKVDPQQIQQVFRNLISNGVEAMPDGGTLQICASESVQDKTVTISVKDSGVGMTQEQLKKLFTPLATTKARGIGLGLVVVENLVQANGGRIEVISEAGKGTIFKVTLPI